MVLYALNLVYCKTCQQKFNIWQWEDRVWVVWPCCQPFGVQEADCVALCLVVDLLRNAGN